MGMQWKEGKWVMAMRKPSICIEREALFLGTHRLLGETKPDMTLRQVIKNKIIYNQRAERPQGKSEKL